MSKNINLYRVHAGERFPLLSLDATAPDFDAVSASALVSARMAQELSHCNRSGQPLPTFVTVSEEREADENGRVTHGEFQRLDAQLKPVGKARALLADVFAAPKKDAPAPQEQPEDRRSRDLSK